MHKAKIRPIKPNKKSKLRNLSVKRLRKKKRRQPTKIGENGKKKVL